jgi:hypothetical protein
MSSQPERLRKRYREDSDADIQRCRVARFVDSSHRNVCTTLHVVTTAHYHGVYSVSDYLEIATRYD